MIEANEKSTVAPWSRARIHPEIVLDSRLAIFHEKANWLAAADIHFGYEISRRADGGLWPMWGMGSIEERFAALLSEYRPDTVILVGDVVDSGMASREASAWLKSIRERCRELLLVAGNHDRGPIRREFEFVESVEAPGGFFFHHGHEGPEIPEDHIEITGHWHPSVSLHDGAGTRLRLPSLVQESVPAAGREHWVLPAFSPWAGGGPWQAAKSGEVRQWACGADRVFEWVEPEKF